MKIVSYNVNGIRAALKKGLAEWLAAARPDVLCLQEIKADSASIPLEPFQALGYHCSFFPAEKKGYSGVGILSLRQPDAVTFGCGDEDWDREGRHIRADFGDISVLSVYTPSGSSSEIRQAIKMQFCEWFNPYLKSLTSGGQHLIVMGDINICHQDMDIHSPKTNQRSSGFLPEERQWMAALLNDGFTDSFRHMHPERVAYSWWSQRFGARAKNLGWRIDYGLVSNGLKHRIADADIWPDVIHSDHCPIFLEIANAE